MSVREFHLMECPKCHGDNALDVLAWARLIDDGTAPAEGTAGTNAPADLDAWDGNSPCRCALCGWQGTAGDARDAVEYAGEEVDDD